MEKQGRQCNGSKEGRVSRRAFLKKSAIVMGTAAAGFSFPYIKTHAAEPIRLGSLQNMSGAYYAYGIQADRSARAAVKRINEMGGINGRSIEYILEDAATNVQTAVRKLRKLIMQDKCDFVLGSEHSGIAVAVAPIVKELKTVYFPFATSLSLTGDKGNRYIFRGIGNNRQGMAALGRYVYGRLGKSYYCLALDYEWGHSMVDETKRVFDQLGATFVGVEYTPMGIEDFMPYLNKLDPKKIDMLVVGFSVDQDMKLLNQANEMGLLKTMWVIGGSMPGGVAPKDWGLARERRWWFGYGPQTMDNIPEHLKAFNRSFRNAINMDDEGRYKETGEYGVASYAWVTWEHVHWIKNGIEKSGWQNKADTPKFIKALEGMKVKAGYDFIQGDKEMRAQDHQVLTDIYIMKIEKEAWTSKGVVKAAEISYEPTADFTKEEF